MQWLNELCNILKENGIVLIIALLVISMFIENIFEAYFKAKNKKWED